MYCQHRDNLLIGSHAPNDIFQGIACKKAVGEKCSPGYNRKITPAWNHRVIEASISIPLYQKADLVSTPMPSCMVRERKYVEKDPHRLYQKVRRSRVLRGTDPYKNPIPGFFSPYPCRAQPFSSAAGADIHTMPCGASIGKAALAAAEKDHRATINQTET